MRREGSFKERHWKDSDFPSNRQPVCSNRVGGGTLARDEFKLMRTATAL